MNQPNPAPLALTSDDFAAFDLDGPKDNSTEYSFRELLDMIQEEKEIILTIPNDQVADLKAGLISRKAKDNRKLKAAGLVVSKDVIKFTIYPAKDGEGNEIPDVSCVQIAHGPRAGITVLDIKKPDNNF